MLVFFIAYKYAIILFVKEIIKMAETKLETIKPAVNGAVKFAPTATTGTFGLDSYPINATADGNTFTWDSTTALFIINTKAGAITATITRGVDSGGNSKTITLVIAEDGYGIVNFLDPYFHNAGIVKVTFDALSTGYIIPVSFIKGA